jgi:hypothetical protein
MTDEGDTTMKVTMVLRPDEFALLTDEMATAMKSEPTLGLTGVFAYPSEAALAADRVEMLSALPITSFALAKRWFLRNQDLCLDQINAFEGYPVGVIKALIPLEELGDAEVPMYPGAIIAAAILLGVAWRRDYPMPEVRFGLSPAVVPWSGPEGAARHAARMAELAAVGLVPASVKAAA